MTEKSGVEVFKCEDSPDFEIHAREEENGEPDA